MTGPTGAASSVTGPTGAVGPTGANASTPAYVFTQNGSVINVAASNTVVLSKAMTPTVTGKVTVRLTGIVENTDSSATHSLFVSLGTAAAGIISSYNALRVPVKISATNGSATVAMVEAFDMDLLNPTTLPLSAQTIQVTMRADAGSVLTFPLVALEFEAQERP